MKQIELTKGMFAIVDDEDFPYLNRFHWLLETNGNYFKAVRTFFIDRKSIIVPMWKFVVQSENNKEIIYKNKNSLDNRKENLLLVPAYVANHKSMKKSIGNNGKPTSKYKGVCYSASYLGRKKWIADIVSNGKRFSKHFLTEKEAVIAYNEKAKEFYGEFAYQNKIEN